MMAKCVRVHAFTHTLVGKNQVHRHVCMHSSRNIVYAAGITMWTMSGECACVYVCVQLRMRACVESEITGLSMHLFLLLWRWCVFMLNARETPFGSTRTIQRSVCCSGNEIISLFLRCELYVNRMCECWYNVWCMLSCRTNNYRSRPRKRPN